MSFITENVRINTRLDAVTGSGHIVTTNKGDLISDNGTNTVAVPIGSNNQIMIADSAEDAGFRWGTLNNAIIGAGANIDATKIADGSVTNTEFQRLADIESAAVGETDTQTLTNKTLTDASTYIQDDADNTKKVQFQVSSVTTGNTRTLTIPDEDTTIVGTGATQTLTNKTIDADSNSISNIDNADIKAGAAIDASKIADGSVSNAEFQQLAEIESEIVGVSDTQTLTNKTLIDNSTNIVDNADNTKKVQFQVSGVDTATTRTLTVPNESTTIAGTDATQTFTNKAWGDNLNMNSNKIIGLNTPTSDTDAANKSYVDSVAQGLDAKDAVRVKTTTAFPAYTQAGSGVGATLTADANGGLPTIDGESLVVNDRILVSSEATTNDTHNGIYEVTQVGDGSNPWILTRANDADNDSDVNAGLFVFVTEGTMYADNGFILTTDNPITVDTTALNFTQFSGAGHISAGDGLMKSGNMIKAVGSTTVIANSDDLEVNSSSTANQILLSSGTVGTASTFGSLPLGDTNAVSGQLTVPNGGTGVATLTSGNFVEANGSSAFTATKAVPSGAVVGTSDSQTLTNKTLTTPIISTISNTGTLTLPSSTDTLVGRATTDTLTNKSIDADNNTITNIDNADIKAGAAIDATKIADGSVSNDEFQRLSSVNSSVVGETDTQTLTNKSFVDNSTYFVDEGDNTKKVMFDAAAITTGTTRTVSVPDATFTMLGEDTAQTVTNKTWGDNLNMDSNRITNIGTPTASTDAANKDYVDGVAQGLDPKDAARVKTTTALPSYSKAGTGVGATLTADANGALPSIDGVALSVNDRILVDSSGTTTDVHNGIYEVTQLGNGSNPWILTRATDADEDAEVNAGLFVFVTEGNECADCGFILTTNNPITIDTTSLSFTQFSGAGQITAGTGMTKSGNTLDVVGSVTVLANANSLEVNSSNTANQVLLSAGTVDTASTFGSLPLGDSNAVSGQLTVTHGGTGVSSLTSGNFVQANGASAFTATKAVPSGNVVGTSDTQTLTNKTLTTPVISTISNTGTLTLPTSTDTLVGRNTTDTLTNKTLIDDSTYIADNADNTKKLQFQVSGISTSTTRTLTAPDANTTIVGTDVSQTLTNKTIDADLNPISNIDNADIKVGAAIDAAKIANGSVSNTEFQQLGNVSSAVMAVSDSQTVTNKDLVDNSTNIVDNADNTKKVQFDVSTVDTATTRTLTAPNESTTIVGTDATQTLTNKTWGDNLNMNDSKIVNLNTPTADSDAANKSYVDSVAQGIDAKDAVRVKTDAAFPAYTQSGTGQGATLTADANGAIPTIDGITLVADDRVLVTTEATTDDSHNGIYVVTQVGDGSNPWILTRSTDADMDVEVTSGLFTFVSEGTMYANNGFILTTDNPITLDTTGLHFTQFSGAGQITAGDGLMKTANTIYAAGGTTIIADPDSLKVNSSATANQLLLSAGTVGTEATFGALPLGNTDSVSGQLGVAHGGTGIATLTTGRFLEGNGTSAVITTKIVPTGDVVGTSDSQTLTNKTLTTPVISTISNTGTVTLPTSTDTLVGRATTDTLTNKTINADNNTITNIDNNDIKAGAAIDATKIADGSVTNTEFQRLSDVGSSVVGESDTQTLTNKTLTDASTYIQDNLDNTKKIQFQVSSVTTGNTRTLTAPDENTTIVGTDASQTLTNKTMDFDLNTVTNIDNANIKSSAAIDASKIANGTVSNTEFQQLAAIGSAAVGVSDSQNLTNKTLTSANVQTALNDINGNELIKVSPTAYAVNEITVTNATTTNGPIIEASGNDTNVDLNINAKGSGNVVVDGLKMPNSDGEANQVLKTDGAGNIGYADVDILTMASVTTTNNTETTITSMATSSDSAYIVEAHVIGLRTDSGSETCGFVLRCVFRNNGGTLTKVGDDKMYAKDSGSNWDADSSVSGTNIIITVTGQNSKTIKWKVSCKFTSVSA